MFFDEHWNARRRLFFFDASKSHILYDGQIRTQGIARPIRSSIHLLLSWQGWMRTQCLRIFDLP